MTRKLKGTLIAAPVVAALVFGGVAIAGATGGSDDGEGTPIGGNALDRAKTIALEQTGGGRVTATEVRDEEGYYEVEVTRADGSQTDVHLTRDFGVIDDHPDADGCMTTAPTTTEPLTFLRQRADVSTATRRTAAADHAARLIGLLRAIPRPQAVD